MWVYQSIDFLSSDVVMLARQLLGKMLHTNIGGVHCSGIITETEAYAGVEDKASHAWGGRLTKRNEVMYRAGGIAYVYFSYGMHHLFNIVTGPASVPHAVLIRSVWPMDGIDLMQLRRGKHMPLGQLTNGPAKLCKAMGIDLKHNGAIIGNDQFWLTEMDYEFKGIVTATPRIGIDYAGEDALLPYRFVLSLND